MPLHTHLHLKDEHVLWRRRMSPLALWPFWLLGLATIWLYGLGLLFWLYAAVKWVRVRYLVTSRRVISAEDHYAFLLRVETCEIPLAEVTDIAVSRGWVGDLLGYADVTIHGDGRAVTLSGLRHPDELRETLRPYL
jgi:membrane protein YdbS with pleckstrin-like domain